MKNQKKVTYMTNAVITKMYIYIIIINRLLVQFDKPLACGNARFHGKGVFS